MPTTDTARRRTEHVMDPNIAQWVARTITRTSSVYALGVGATILAGGSDRFNGLSYAVAINTPGAPASWGVVIATAGLVMLTGSLLAKPRVIGFGALLAAMWSLMFAWAFAVSAVRFADANTTAPWSYGFLFLMFGVLSGAHFASNPIRLPGRRRRGVHE